MEVLLLGGTGAMGMHAAHLLAERGNDVSITSRGSHEDTGKIKYIRGNAKDLSFVSKLCEKHWDVIIDFMIYTTEELTSRLDILLSSAGQYIFISSARVYADSTGIINEESPLLLDVCEDSEYLKTNEYALAKAKEERLLLQSGRGNWTIVRPSLTYAENRLQLGAYEKENWLYRALHGRSIVFSKDLMERYYTLTYGKDVSDGIAALAGNEKALGKMFHIVYGTPVYWKEVLDIYLDTLEQVTGKRPDVILTERCTNLWIQSARYQVLYGRYFNRRFDNSRIASFADTSKWLDPKAGLSLCLREFLKDPVFRPVNWKKEALLDRAAHEWTPLKEIKGKKLKLKYIAWRLFGVNE